MLKPDFVIKPYSYYFRVYLRFLDLNCWVVLHCLRGRKSSAFLTVKKKGWAYRKRNSKQLGTHSFKEQTY